MIKKLPLLLAIYLVAGISIAQAATITIVADNTRPDINQPVHVVVMLDTQGENVNAVQGKIIFPARLFVLQSVADGSSPVSFWINQPKETVPGTISFAGIMPGGFTGAHSPAFSFVLIPRASGSGDISIDGAAVLRNDGQGSLISTAAKGQSVTVSNVNAGEPLSPASSTILPEPFTPVVARDPDVFGGKYFLAFSTTDKGSGIDHYDVVEISAGSPLGADASWQTAESPYLLKDQTLSSDSYVRAVNHAGGVTIGKAPAVHPGVSPFVLISLALLTVLGLLWLLRRRGRRRSL